MIAASAILVAGRLLFDNLLYEMNKRILLAGKYVKEVKKPEHFDKDYYMNEPLIDEFCYICCFRRSYKLA